MENDHKSLFFGCYTTYILSSAYEEKAILHKVGAKFDTPEKQKQLWSFRLQQHLANKILFSSLWEYPTILIEIVKHTGLAEDETVKRYIDRLQ